VSKGIPNATNLSTINKPNKAVSNRATNHVSQSFSDKTAGM